jgi:hypothetical protein
VPNLSVTIRNFSIAVRGYGSEGSTGALHRPRARVEQTAARTRTLTFSLTLTISL